MKCTRDVGGSVFVNLEAAIEIIPRGGGGSRVILGPIHFEDVTECADVILKCAREKKE
jgi:hypothetical protein